MRRWIALTCAAFIAAGIATACNTITGLDDITGRECQTAADCPEAGECTRVSCTEGQCAFEVAAREPCSIGACTADGVCVECVSDEGCVDELRPVCDTEQHRCIECNTHNGCAAGKSCRDGRCVECWDVDQDGGMPCGVSKPICSVIDGRCVECDFFDHCSNQKLPDTQCWEFLCVERNCVPTPTVGLPCMGGICKENGLCSPVPL
ncbi:hypothetical protein [Polyangium aurulentum]|uniref:hypothetical protein n=1 Tax=Polyangium aurulentum TaxID=2567896 RepID=UPI0010AEDE41|nr:hypothetical protein [Polyangium aurulentum]UQA59509.1 hypothetical protein E8A73_003070 [Polyangium aurulentum]